VGHRAEDELDLLRKGSGLSIDRDGKFLHCGQSITHARTREVLWRSLERTPDGRYLVRIGREWAYVDIEDAPYAIRGVLEGEDRLTLVLSDGTQEPLDPATLCVDGWGALHCQVKGGHRARFTSTAQVALGLALDEDPPGSGRYLLTLRGTRWPVRRE
jgi:hypothetical protein